MESFQVRIGNQVATFENPIQAILAASHAVNSGYGYRAKVHNITRSELIYEFPPAKKSARLHFPGAF